MTATHLCPGPRCGGKAPIPYDMLMCRADWAAVPRPIRNAVYRAWDNGAGAGTADHQRAVQLAIRAAQRGQPAGDGT